MLLFQRQVEQVFANSEELGCIAEERVAIYSDVICASICVIGIFVGMSVCVSVCAVGIIAIGGETIGPEIEIEETQVAASFPKALFLLSVMSLKFRQRNFEKWCRMDGVGEWW